jgi:hypothetical protein
MPLDPTFARVPHYLSSLPSVSGQNVQDVFEALRAPLAGGLSALNFRRNAGIPNANKAEPNAFFLLRSRFLPNLAVGPWFATGVDYMAMLQIPDLQGNANAVAAEWGIWSPNPPYNRGTGNNGGVLTAFTPYLYCNNLGTVLDTQPGSSWPSGTSTPMVNCRPIAITTIPGDKWYAKINLTTITAPGDSLPGDIFFDLWLKTSHVK